MIRKIIYLMQVPLSAREFLNFGPAWYLEQGLEVEIWECTPFLNPAFQTVARPEGFSAFRQFKDKNEVIAAIRAEAATDVAVINLLPRNFFTLPIFAALNRSVFQSVEVRTNAIPLGPGRFIKKIKKLSPGRLFNYFLRRPGFWQQRAGRPGRIIYGGKACRPGKHEAERLISAHALDYDAYLAFCEQHKRVASANLALPADQPQIVFLDQNFPFHSDFKVLKRRPPATPERYFPSLQRFFDALEADLDMPVIIAAHPRAAYASDPGTGVKYFGQRKLCQGNTLALVCESSLVLTHTSTAVNFAVMARRPVLVMTTNELEKDEGATIRLIADTLGLRPLNIDDLPLGWNKNLLSFDEQAYTAYFEKYIKEPGSPDLPFWQILLADLNKSSFSAA